MGILESKYKKDNLTNFKTKEYLYYTDIDNDNDNNDTYCITNQDTKYSCYEHTNKTNKTNKTNLVKKNHLYDNDMDMGYQTIDKCSTSTSRNKKNKICKLKCCCF